MRKSQQRLCTSAPRKERPMPKKLPMQDALGWAFDRVLLSPRRALELLDQKELAAIVASAATAICFSNEHHNIGVYGQVRNDVRAHLPRAYLSWQKQRNTKR